MDDSGRIIIDGGSIPGYAPTGGYLLAGCQLEQCDSTTVVENIKKSGIAIEAFRLEPRLADITVNEEVAFGGAAVDHLNAGWVDPLASPSDIVKVVWYKDGEGLVEYENGVLSESIDLFRFLDTDRQGVELYQPTIVTSIAPGLPRYLPVYPTLEPGDYTVEVYLNGVLEASKDVNVGQ